jgi:hypothetical protein
VHILILRTIKDKEEYSTASRCQPHDIVAECYCGLQDNGWWEIGVTEAETMCDA